ncbi:hypothetical protein MesoLj113a_21370 [Mesorhizobium sp. 113-1-2]|uniref:hypothetical protein n=1 Tax=Mesorhizobium sp. 113-1-2 TaxID=2744515 RepID=UPI0008199692|nr:hypothetical protein [Mesorhizobium sp. 113-1-2]BAV47835.1 Putative uncharacterized protein [Mesorhizobium loti]BCG70979.1 hypothetical protein MesoLj113a_21370 [Mesorhizobium sp. 113-1-2]
MSDLLNFALEAHGGLKRWNEFQTLRAELSIGGAIWEVKHCQGLLTDKTIDLQTHYQQLSITPYLKPGLRTVFVPDRQTLETLTGEVAEVREHPETAFENHVRSTPWDKFHAAFFASEALWTYLTSPFLYTYPGFESEEIDPWYENGERWRRLRVTFPDHIVSHTRTQITHFGPDGLMRRHDYTVDILGGATGANYTTNYQDFQGLMMPMTRRIYAYDEKLQKVPEPLLVSIDFRHVTFVS